MRSWRTRLCRRSSTPTCQRARPSLFRTTHSRSGSFETMTYRCLPPTYGRATDRRSTTLPHLPFEDNYFDLIYSGSVFTHISDLADAWLLELRRVLRPDGMLYITVHDDHTVDVLKADLPDFYLTRLVLDYEAEVHLNGRPWHMFAIRRSPRAAMVFYQSDYLREQWGRELTVRSFTREAYGYQSAILLQK